LYEDYATDAAAVLCRCFTFLGVDPAVSVANAQRARHTSANRREDRAVTNVLRRTVPGFHQVRDAVPRSVRLYAGQLLKKPLEGRPEWPAELRRGVWDEIADDVYPMLDKLDRPYSVWDLPKAAV